ncbi:tail sheath [Burkholderia phage vB_BglM_WTB]
MISQSRFIRITSGVGAGAAVAQRQLIMRVMTTSSLLAPSVIGEFSQADDVGTFFGMQSEEFARAQAYFSFVSKSIGSPATISFARVVSTATPALVVGDTLPKSFANVIGLANATITINVNGTAVPVTGFSFTTAKTLTDVAAQIQVQVRASTNPLLSNASVTFNTNTNQFTLSGSITGATSGGTITVTPTGAANDLGPLLGWGTTGTVTSPAMDAETLAGAMARTTQISDNFGSFVSTGQFGTAFMLADVTAAAQWNATQNNKFMYCVPVPLASIGAVFSAVGGFSGTAITLVDPNQPVDFAEQSPAEILAATDYTKINATQNYMFYQFASRNVTVSDDATANTCDQNRTNYIGVTQTAGQKLAFYQRGILCGGPTDATDMNTYANEMWLKSAITAQVLTTFLGLPRVPANNAGRAILTNVIQAVVTTGKNNGTISSGKQLTPVQQQFVTQVTGDSTAWRQLQTIGYWLRVDFQQYVNTQTSLNEYKAVYTLVYSKDDAIRLVEGTDTLI